MKRIVLIICAFLLTLDLADDWGCGQPNRVAPHCLHHPQAHIFAHNGHPPGIEADSWEDFADDSRRGDLPLHLLLSLLLEIPLPSPSQPASTEVQPNRNRMDAGQGGGSGGIPL